MEDNFYLDDFELSLKEQANKFKMTPSKKVWHGIYNDMHPGRRWPSITVSLLLVISIVFVGYINTHSDKELVESKQQAPAKSGNINKEQSKSIDQKLVTSEKTGESKNVSGANSAKQKQVLVSTPFDKSNGQGHTLANASNNSNQIKSHNSEVVQNTGIMLSDNMQNKPTPTESKKADGSTGKRLSNSLVSNTGEAIANMKSLRQPEKDNITSYERSLVNGFEKRLMVDSSILFINEMKIITVNIPDNNSIDNSITTNKIGNDNTILMSANVVFPAEEGLNIKSRRKQNSKTTWLFYAGSYANTVSFSGNQLTGANNQNPLSLPQVTQKDSRIMHNPAIGFEAGVQMNYLFAKKLQFTVGTHFTRSGYNIISNEVHPTLTTLLLKDKTTGDQYSRNFVTHFGDGHGQSTTTLHNYNYQASLPVGIQYQILGNDKIQFNIGINVEPSLVLKSTGYILSSDGRNYVNVPDLYRKWNLNSNFTPFITFKSDKLKWNIGPVVRYQWLSTYMDNYTIKEHLINYGIRVGISK